MNNEQRSPMKTSLKNHLVRCLAVSCLLTISTTNAQTPYILGGLETTSMTRIVPDKILFPTGLPAINTPLGNWEPYTSVLGTSTFLIEANTYAEGSTTLQRYRVAFQPAAGGPNVEGEVFYADDGTPFTTQINRSRQDGNPGRVAGDARRGATNFMVGGEASPNAYVTGSHSFGSDGRWSLGLVRPVDARFATVQTYSLNPGTLTQTMLSKAQDSAYGRDTSGDASASQQYTRFGGDMVALDNGNFVSVVEDRSTILSGSGNAATATIFAPDGTIVKERFMVAPGSIWGNVAPFLGGFCVRVLGVLHFFDNDGNEMGTGIDQATALDDFDGSVLFPFTAGDRGDDQRVAGHINSPYVFMAQRRGLDIYVAAFDSRLAASGSAFVGEINVNELEPAAGGTDTSTFQEPTGWPGQGRVKVAVDALNRVAVASQVDLTAQHYGTNQVVMRVLKFDDSVSPKKFTYLTHSFVVFLNASTNANNTAASFAGNIAMTTKQICIAAKGQINLANNPNAAADSPGESNFYTVISHPDPQDDPTKWAVRVQDPEAAGLSPRTGTIYVNANTNFNYNNTDNPYVDITADHKAAICWADGSSPNTDFISMNAVWTLYDANGNNLIPPTVITNRAGAVGPTTLTNNWLAVFRPDGSSTPGSATANSRIRANRFGNGILFGTRGDRLGLEIPDFLAINTDDSGPITTLTTGSGFPVVQLINNDGTPGAGIVTGVNDADAQPTGQVGIHGMEYLANGNIVILSESRQDQALVDQFGGTTPNRHVVYRVVKPNGDVVKATSLASETTDRTEVTGFMVGVTSNGFALRFSYRPRHDGSGRTSGTIRLFDNNGNPVSGDINQSDAVGAFLGTGPNNPTGGNGGRGDSVGFHGNGRDAYVNVCVGDQEGVRGPVYVTVYNADGTVRWHRPVADAGETNACEQVDGAIATDGRVLVAMDDHVSAVGGPSGATRLIVGKMFDPAGKSMGPMFYVSELETLALATKDTATPGVVWRDNYIAYVWRSLNSTATPNAVIGFRMFNDVATTPPSLAIAKSGGNAVLTWSATATGYTLRSKVNVSAATWQTNSPAPVLSGGVFTVTEPIGPTSKVYQLIK
jgi:hypothetical protein